MITGGVSNNTPLAFFWGQLADSIERAPELESSGTLEILAFEEDAPS